MTARITLADLDSARAYARAHVADRDLWPLLNRLADEAQRGRNIADAAHKAIAWEVKHGETCPHYDCRSSGTVEPGDKCGDDCDAPGESCSCIVDALDTLRATIAGAPSDAAAWRSKCGELQKEVASLRTRLARVEVPDAIATAYDR